MKIPEGTLDQRQKNTLRIIRELFDRFYESNDNQYTYALTGLLRELTRTNYIDMNYVMQKIEVIKLYLKLNEVNVQK